MTGIFIKVFVFDWMHDSLRWGSTLLSIRCQYSVEKNTLGYHWRLPLVSIHTIFILNVWIYVSIQISLRVNRSRHLLHIRNHYQFAICVFLFDTYNGARATSSSIIFQSLELYLSDESCTSPVRAHIENLIYPIDGLVRQRRILSVVTCQCESDSNVKAVLSSDCTRIISFLRYVVDFTLIYFYILHVWHLDVFHPRLYRYMDLCLSWLNYVETLSLRTTGW